MERFTTNKDVSEMGMYELAHNCCYYKDGSARCRDFESDIDARELTRQLLVKFADGDDAFQDDEDFDEEMLELLQYRTETIEGLVALFYRNLWAMADLREKLKEYEDAEEKGLLLRLHCKVGNRIFAIQSNRHYEIMEVKKIEIKHCVGFGDFCYYLEPVGHSGSLYRYYEDDFGKTVFLTQEEAEQKLKETEDKQRF